MNRLIHAGLIALGGLELGCGAEDGSGGGCARPDGSYEVVYDERSGNCGEMTSDVVRFKDGEQVVLGSNSEYVCDDKSERSADGCRTDILTKCDRYDAETGELEVTIRTSGVRTTLDAAATRIDLVLDVSSTLPTGERCESVYDVTLTKI